MIGIAAPLAALLLQTAGDATLQHQWILTCEVGAPDTATSDRGAQQRVFRLGPRLFQEWSPAEHRFGPNLCQSFTCSVDRGRLQGQISSTTVNLTITVDPKTRVASWRTVGATGLSRSSGPCAVKRDTAPPPKGL